MAATDTIPMLQDFPRWLAATGMGDNEARRNARWEGIRALARDSDRAQVETLLRIALKSRHAAPSTDLEAIRNTFYKADNTFEMKGNDKELQILASAALAAVMSLSDDTAADAAVTISAALVSGHRKPNLPMDLNVLANAAITRIAESNSKRPNLSAFVSTDAPKFDFEKASAKTKENSWEGVAAGFTLAADATRAGMAALAKRQALAIGEIDRFLRMQDEELQMLWWLTGERSLDLDERFEAVTAELQPLLFAKELADATEFLPGPRSVRALLSRAGLKDRKKVAISSVMNAAPPGWVQTFMPEAELSPVTTPLHFALSRQRETGAGEAWVAGWAATVELPSDLGLTPLALALLFYRERLLMLLGGE